MTGAEAGDDFDILIIGGGAAGAAMGIALALQGWRLALVEARAPSFSSSDPERVIALNEGSRRHLARLGAWPAELEAGAGVIAHIVVGEPGGEGRVDLTLDQARAAAGGDVRALGFVVEMGALLAAMHARLRALGVPVLAPAQPEAMAFGEDAARVRLAGGMAREVRARLVIGADGTNSIVRRMAGIGTRGWDYNRFGIVASVRCARSHGRMAWECFRADGPLAFLPLGNEADDGRFSIVWAVRHGAAADLLACGDDTFIAMLNQAAGARFRKATGGVRAVSRRAVWPLELTLAQRLTGRRLALIGNAAHTVHPVAGQGLNLGLRDVAALARLLADEARKPEGRRDPGRPLLLDAYADARRADMAAVAAFTEGMTAIFGCEAPGARFARGLGLDALNRAGFLRDALIRHAAGLGGVPGGASSEIMARQAAG